MLLILINISWVYSVNDIIEIALDVWWSLVTQNFGEAAVHSLACCCIRITHCTSYFHHNPQHHRTITSDAAPMTDNCINTKDT